MIEEGGNPWQPVHLAAMMLLVKSFVQNAAHPYSRQEPARVKRMQPTPVHVAAERLNQAQHSACIAAHH
jgi:hypothetical protein